MYNKNNLPEPSRSDVPSHPATAVTSDWKLRNPSHSEGPSIQLWLFWEKLLVATRTQTSARSSAPQEDSSPPPLKRLVFNRGKLGSLTPPAASPRPRKPRNGST